MKWCTSASRSTPLSSTTVRANASSGWALRRRHRSAARWAASGLPRKGATPQGFGLERSPRLLLTDASGATVMDFKIDYLSAAANTPCGYGTLGVSGGEGKILLGDASAVLGVATSIDRNLNGCGSCYTEDSPATDGDYTPNADAPNWDYRVVTRCGGIDAFGSAGFVRPKSKRARLAVEAGEPHVESRRRVPARLGIHFARRARKEVPKRHKSSEVPPKRLPSRTGANASAPRPFATSEHGPCPQGYQWTKRARAAMLAVE